MILRLFAVGCLGAAICGWSVPRAFAYVPPSQFIVRSWVNKRQLANPIKVQSTVARVRDGKPTEVFFRATTWFDPKTRVLKARALDAQGHEIDAVERRLPLVPQGSKVDDSVPLADHLLFDPRAETTCRVLQAHGYSIRMDEELLAMKDEDERRASEKVSLARWGTRVAWAVGDTPAQQLWFEKDTFLPVRALFLGGELRLQEYRSEVKSGPMKDFAFPRKLRWISSASATTAQGADAALDYVEEDVTEIAISGVSEPKWKATEPSSADSEVRDLARVYFARMR